MRRIPRIPWHSFGLAALATLATACGGGDGGGGGNDDGNPPVNPPPASTSVTGTAAKGLLANAVVNFYGVSSSGTVDTTSLGTTRTNSLGVFTASVAASGPVVVTVTADAQTTMLDEVSGEMVDAPAGLTLHAVVSGLTTTPMAVTPLTEMAYGIASASSGGLTVANVDAANSLVSAAMLDGASVLTTLPVNLSDYKSATVAQQSQAKLMTALAIAASEGFATGSSGSTCSQSDYSARLVCMIDGLKALMTVGASNSATFTARSAYLVTAYERINRGLVTVMGGQEPGALGLELQTTAEKSLVAAISSQTALFGYVASASPVANTKALFADLRTNILQQQAGEDIFGVAPTLAAVQADYQANVLPVVSGTRAVLVGAYTAAALLDASVAGTYVRASGHVVCGYDPAVLGTVPEAALCRYGDEYDQQILLTATRTALGTYSVTTQPMTFTPWTGDPGEYNEIFNPYYGGTLSASTSIASLSASFTFTATTGGVLSASWKGPYYVTIDGGRVTADLSASQSDDWNPATISGTLRVGGSVSGGAGGIALTEATIGDDSEIVVQNGALIEGTAPSVYGALNLSRLATNAFEYAVRASIGEPVYDSSESVGVPRDVTVTGSVRQLGTVGSALPLFNGTIQLATQGIASFDATQPVGPSNSFGAQVQVIGNLALPGGRVLAVSLAANGSQLEATPDAPYSLSVTYAYSTPGGVARINISGEYDATDGYAATVTTNSGVTVVLSRPLSGKLTGTVTANGEVTATIDGTTINYSDGDTESIF